ncbi:DUF4292 domain-containing protein [Mangrovimonas spongiae]|uniref:DUF4292 domain-containing protein n=1 Tax=Mangrovimonas spongiae TaxID=2494697 RepID=A0A3R9UWA9_9FLAO|nr:DUF4292 domain-containing protein [Mangrovimonas spongiae]RSK41474.1 DUF4292 domain-containing protein [Mangrovimonas spongiae]
MKKTPNKIITGLLLVLLITCFGCKTKHVVTDGNVNPDLSEKYVIKEHLKTAPSFKTLQAKVRISYTEDNSTQSHTVTFRMLKDGIIWLTAPLNIVRAKITPESVGFYNKLDNTYFEGDFSYISDMLGTDVNFEKVQNLLLGQPLFGLDNETHKMSIHNNNYMFQPNEQSSLFELFYLINATLNMESQQLAQASTQRFLQIDYLEYQTIEKQTFPKNIKVISLEGDQETIIELEFKSISLNQDLRYPFKIPKGYDEIELD